MKKYSSFFFGLQPLQHSLAVVAKNKTTNRNYHLKHKQMLEPLFDFMKQILLIATLMIFCGACQKEAASFLTIKGRVIDGYNNQIVSNFPVHVGYINPVQGMGFNLGNWENISNCTTDMNGNFTLTTPYPMAKDTGDFYKIEAFSSINYFGFSKTIDAKQAESQRDINLGDIKLDKIITLNLTIHHSGINNYADFIIGDVNHMSFLYYGSDSVIKNTYWISFNKPCIINWRYTKNNFHYGPFADTLIFTNLNNDYSISY